MFYKEFIWKLLVIMYFWYMVIDMYIYKIRIVNILSYFNSENILFFIIIFLEKNIVDFCYYLRFIVGM